MFFEFRIEPHLGTLSVTEPDHVVGSPKQPKLSQGPVVPIPAPLGPTLGGPGPRPEGQNLDLRIAREPLRLVSENNFKNYPGPGIGRCW